MGCLLHMLAVLLALLLTPMIAQAEPERCPSCTTPVIFSDAYRDTLGERARYVVELNGLAVGNAEFTVNSEGRLESQSVIEYRGQFVLDSFISSMTQLHGQAASVMTRQKRAAVHSMLRFKAKQADVDERVKFFDLAHRLYGTRSRSGKIQEDHRALSVPIWDALAAYYLMRALPPESSGCFLVYAQRRLYTVWFKHVGLEKIATPLGLRPAHYVKMHFRDDRTNAKVHHAEIWLGQIRSRIPYRFVLNGKDTLVARIESLTR